jgi:hypothetical protein
MVPPSKPNLGKSFPQLSNSRLPPGMMRGFFVFSFGILSFDLRYNLAGVSQGVQ